MKLNPGDSALGATSLRGSSPASFWLVGSQILHCSGRASAELEALAAETPCPVPASPQQRWGGDEDKTRQLLQSHLAHAQHLIRNLLVVVTQPVGELASRQVCPLRRVHGSEL